MKVVSKNSGTELGTETKNSENFNYVCYIYSAFEKAFWIAAALPVNLPIKSPLYAHC